MAQAHRSSRASGAPRQASGRIRGGGSARGAAISLLAFASALASVVGPAVSEAQAAVVYHSPADDGAPAAGSPTIPEGGVQSVYLYIDDGPAASAPSSACNDGQGDEICGYELELSGTGGLTVSGFVADAGADVMVNQSAGGILIGGLDTVSPAPGPKRIGELQVNAATGGGLDLIAGEVVGADLGTSSLAAATVATVPEPGVAASTLLGALLLGALRLRRASR